MIAIPNFRKYFERASYSKIKLSKPKVGNHVLSIAIENLCREIQNIVMGKEKRPIKTKYLRPIVYEEFKPQHYEDIYELFTYFLKKLSKEQKERGF